MDSKVVGAASCRYATHPDGVGHPPGTGRLSFENVAGRTATTESYAASPLKFIHPQNHGSAAWAVCGTYGGGLLGGDDISIRVRAGEETQIVFMTQASTKIYRSGAVAKQTLDCEICKGALLVSAPDRVACFAGSSLDQVQRFSLEEGANLIALDWLSAGRLDSGERWRFDQCRSRLEVSRAGRTVFRDTLLLDANHGPLPVRMSRFNTLATLLITGPKLAAGSSALLENVAAQSFEKIAGPNMRVAASPFAEDGVMLRCAGEDVEALGKYLRSALSFVVEIIGDDPWARRW